MELRMMFAFIAVERMRWPSITFRRKPSSQNRDLRIWSPFPVADPATKVDPKTTNISGSWFPCATIQAIILPSKQSCLRPTDPYKSHRRRDSGKHFSTASVILISYLLGESTLELHLDMMLISLGSIVWPQESQLVCITTNLADESPKVFTLQPIQRRGLKTSIPMQRHESLTSSTKWLEIRRMCSVKTSLHIGFNRFRATIQWVLGF